MKKLLTILLLATSLFALEVIPSVGLAMNGNLKGSDSNSYVHSESPLGIFELRLKQKLVNDVSGIIKYKHISSIPQIDETQGINEIDALIEYKYVYAGMSYTTDKWTSEYYTDQYGKKSMLVGLVHEFDNGRELYVEYGDSLEEGKKDMLIAGFNLLFYGW